MSPFERLKRDLYGERNRIGMRDKVVVDTRSLIALLEDYEKMDSYAKAQHGNNHKTLTHQLHDVLDALYREDHDSERLMLDIMNILQPKIEKRVNEQEFDKIIGY